MTAEMSFTGHDPPKRGVPFGRYTLREKIAGGKRSATFRATWTDEGGTRRVVALERCSEPAHFESFRAEAAVLKRLQHPNIVQFVDAGSVGGEEFLATELVDGRDLETLLREEEENLRKLPPGTLIEFAVCIAWEITKALEYLHARRWTHLSLSPAAVLLGFDGSVKLCDFHRTSSSAFGAPHHDFTGLGALLRAILPEAIDPQLEALVVRMSMDRSDSFQSCGVLSRELQLYAGARNISLTPEIIEGVLSSKSEPAPQIFVICAPGDRPYCQELEKHVAALRSTGKLRFSSSDAIAPGSDHHAETEKLLSASAVIVPLISADLLNDAGPMRLVERAMALHEAKNAVVVPVRIRHVDVGELPFRKLRSLPANAAPVAAWADRDLAWTEVVRELRVVLGRDRAAFAPEVPVVGDETQRKLAGAIDRLRNSINTAVREGQTPRGLITEQTKLKKKALELRLGRGLKSGDVLGFRFLLQQPIGRGGFGTVWSAYDLEDQRTVAVKVLSADLAQDQRAVARFHRGAEVISTLDHRYVVKLIAEVAQDGDHRYFVMEHAAGGDLQKLVERGAPPPIEARLELIRQVAEALAFAHRHERRFIHRDVKPSNILLHADGTVRLSDFDLVRAEVSWAGTPTNAGLGTFPFAAPEARHDAAEADVRADIYSLAMTAAYVLHGQKIGGDELYEHRHSIIEDLDCAPAIRAALAKAISPRADDRFESVDAFLAACCPEKSPGNL